MSNQKKRIFMYLLMVMVISGIFSMLFAGSDLVSAAPLKAMKLKTVAWTNPGKVRANSGWWIRDRLYAWSKGRLVVDYRGGPEAMARDAQFAALRDGAIDMVYAPASFHEEIVPEMNLIHFAELSTGGLPGPGVWDWLNKRYQRVGVRFLTALKIYGPWYIATIKPVENLDELKKLKIIAGSSPHARFLKALGSTPVLIPPGAETHAALERGVADGACTAIDGWKLGYHEVTKYLVGPSYKSASNRAAFMNLDAWNRLGPELQSVVSDVMKSVSYDAVRRDMGLAAMNMQTWLRAGVKIITPLTADKEEWYRGLYMHESWKKLRKSVSPEVYDKIKELVVLPADMTKLARP